jgi:hypothetical protein
MSIQQGEGTRTIRRCVFCQEYYEEKDKHTVDKCLLVCLARVQKLTAQLNEATESLRTVSNFGQQNKEGGKE